MPFVAVTVTFVILVIARFLLDRVGTVNQEGEKLMTTNTTETTTARLAARLTKLPLLKAFIDSSWWLWLGVGVNSLPPSEAA